MEASQCSKTPTVAWSFRPGAIGSGTLCGHWVLFAAHITVQNAVITAERRYRDGCIKHGVYPWEYWCVSELWRLVDQNSNQILPGVVSTNIRRFVQFSECVENAKGEEGEPAEFDFKGKPPLKTPNPIRTGGGPGF